MSLMPNKRVQSTLGNPRAPDAWRMIEGRAVTALALAGWTSIAHAHGEEAVLFMLGIALVILVVPFAAFLFFWRNSFKRKVILCSAYLSAFPLAFYAALSADIANDWAFIIVLFGIPLCVWLLGVLWLRTRATPQDAPGDADRRRA